MSDEFNVYIGQRVKERRLAHNLTREQLAAEADISDRFLYDIEKGNKGMSAVVLRRVAMALEASADELLDLSVHNIRKKL